ncbi:MAG TPA: hypothetical protein VLR92_08675 [Blastocatellia bacterium]|nr:hypothetical protein [Blastocatellia bacterium]
MNKKPCRDCGYLLDANARGCPRCAMNVEAERKIDGVIGGVLIFVALIVGGTVIYFVLR